MRGIPGTITDPSLRTDLIRRGGEAGAQRAAANVGEPIATEATVTLRVRVLTNEDAAALIKLSVLARNFAEGDTSRTVEVRGFNVDLEG